MKLYLLRSMSSLINVSEQYLIKNRFELISGLVVTYGRVFINSESRVAYFNLFTMFWRQVELALPRTQRVRWHHLHSSGVKAIVTDMCSKQASGKHWSID